jgi:hypothetical protein
MTKVIVAFRNSAKAPEKRGSGKETFLHRLGSIKLFD